MIIHVAKTFHLACTAANCAIKMKLASTRDVLQKHLRGLLLAKIKTKATAHSIPAWSPTAVLTVPS